MYMPKVIELICIAKFIPTILQIQPSIRSTIACLSFPAFAEFSELMTHNFY